jgi:hypothetical protein
MPVDVDGYMATTVGEILGDTPEPPVVVGRFTMPTLPTAPSFPAPGIYFNMPEEQYHAIPALSTGGTKTLAASPMRYWATCLWLNPEYAEYKAEQEAKRKEDDHFDVGHAYHARILEGRDAFTAKYAVALDKKDYPNALVTDEDIKAAFPEGVKPRGKSKRERFDHLLTLDATVELWDDLKKAHADANEGRLMISAKTWKSLEIAAAMIERDPELGKMITGGWPEVSLFWICAKTGVPMKARVDYLKLKAMIDLKTVAGGEKSPENIVRNTIANYRYGIQPVIYLEGGRAVRELVRQGDAAIDGTPEQVAWARKWAEHRIADEWFWIFQQKGIAPIARGVHWPRMGTTHTILDGLVTLMKRRFRTFAEAYGTDPWLDIAPVYDLADEDLPPWACEI